MFEEKCGFSRDYVSLKNALKTIETYDTTCIETGLYGVSQLVLAEWGASTSCQIILITDGSPGLGKHSISKCLATLNLRTNTTNPLPFPFATKLHVVCIASPNENRILKAKPLYQKLIDLCGNGGSFLMPEGGLNETTVSSVFCKLAENIYVTFKASLHCGHLESNIILSPPPLPYSQVTDFDYQTYYVPDTLHICGFTSVNDVGSPMAISRHLILPAPNPNGKKLSGIEGEPYDESKVASFCVLLHGALKVEGMAALVKLFNDEDVDFNNTGMGVWYGIVYAWADTKKKSNLMLTVLPPGPNPVPWLGDLRHLCATDGFPSESIANYPVRPFEKRSYSQNSVVWIQQAGLQSDIQKILRHGRKLPEKTQQFYKELNRLRKAAISLGFIELLTGLAGVFEQEIMQLPGNVSPDCALQLQHAADLLRKTQNRDIKYVIMPLQTNFNSM